MQNDFFNTTNEKNPHLKAYRAKARNQDEQVLRVFEIGRPLSPHTVSRLLGDAYPLTSIRRSITNLTKAGQLEKTNIKVMGRYGRPNYTWRLVK